MDLNCIVGDGGARRRRVGDAEGAGGREGRGGDREPTSILCSCVGARSRDRARRRSASSHCAAAPPRDDDDASRRRRRRLTRRPRAIIQRPTRHRHNTHRRRALDAGRHDRRPAAPFWARAGAATGASIAAGGSSRRASSTRSSTPRPAWSSTSSAPTRPMATPRRTSALAAVAERLPAYGVTSCCPALRSTPPAAYRRLLLRLRPWQPRRAPRSSAATSTARLFARRRRPTARTASCRRSRPAAPRCWKPTATTSRGARAADARARARGRRRRHRRAA